MLVMMLAVAESSASSLPASEEELLRSEDRLTETDNELDQLSELQRNVRTILIIIIIL